MEDVVVLYSEDAAEWSRFIINYIGHEKFKLKISTICDSDIDLDSGRSAPNAKVKVIVVVVSQGHLDFLRSLDGSRRRRYEDLVRKARTAILLLCGIGEEEVEYANAGKQWIIPPGYTGSFKFTHEQYQEMLLKTLAMVEDFDDDQLTGSTVATVVAGEGNKISTKVKEKPKIVAKGKVSKKQDWKFKVIPTTVRVEEPTTMIICFDGDRRQQQQPGSNEGEDSGDAKGETDNKVTLVFGSNNEKLVSAERIDRNTFTFESPEFGAGEVPVKVFVDGDVIGQTAIVYRSFEADLALAIGQVYLFLLNRVLGTVEEYGVLTKELDQLMSDLVDDEAAGGSIPLLAFEQLFAVSTAAAAATDMKGEKSAFDLPTLLHLAARYNLHQLGSKLTDLPHSGAASALRSRQDLTACEMARAKGHCKMIELFETLNGNNATENTNYTLSRKSEENPYLTVKEIDDCILVPSDDKHQTQIPPKESQDQTHRGTDVNTSSEPSSHYESLSNYEEEPFFISQQQVTKPSKQKTSFFGKLLKKSTVQSKSKGSIASPSSTHIMRSDLLPYFQKTPLHTLALDQSETSPPSFRNSVASDSSRDSCISKTSYASGIETNENEEDEMLSSPPLQTFAPKRKSSAQLEQLEADLRNPDRQRPPPVPPQRVLHPEEKHPMPNPCETQSDRIQTPMMRRGVQTLFISSAEDRRQNRAGSAAPSVAPKPRKMSCSGDTLIRQQSPLVEAGDNIPGAKKLTGKSFDQGAGGTDINNELASVFKRKQGLQRHNHSWQQ